MMRWVARLAGFGLLALGIGIPVLVSSQSSDSSSNATFEETTISAYVADFDVADNGDLAVTETLAVEFPDSGKHGIFRFWDVVDPSQSHTRLIPGDVSVTRDGLEEPFEVSSESGGRYRVAKIGSADVTVTPGQHVYVLHFTIDGVLTPGQGDQPTQLYWNLIPGGWRQSITAADLTVRLPAPAQRVKCAVGAGDTNSCTASGEGSTTLEIRAGPLPPFTPVTIQTGLDIPTPAPGRSVPWPVRFDSALGSSLPVAVGGWAVAAVAGLVGWLMSRATHERKPPFPLQYAPPEGIGPAQANYIRTEEADRQAFVASVLHAAEQGAVTLDRSDDAWSITDARGAAGWAGLDPVTSGVANLLSGPGTSFAATSSDVEAGQRLKDEIDRFTKSVQDWANSRGLVSSSWLARLGAILVLVSAVATGWIVLKNPFGARALALIPGLFAIGAVELMATGAITKRTKVGRDLWMRIGGFHRVLSTPSSIERFEFAGRQELYTSYLPWAVGFGCAAEWANKYRTELGTEPPVPRYFGAGYVGSGANGFVDQMVNDFSSTVSSAISSYEATQSSSGGSGGFSGGGGGGGGGGGSW